ncbi:amidase [Vibrio natriegens]|uniref:amidase n=1 Tax=Vibrio natriegens TaxID=691 RepID=UPI00159397B9|nr:amidase [Vibrio natriegens]NVC95605.1 amidase [Vibrio natriegens]
MSELSEVLGALMISLVHARRLADEETAAVAEYYKDHPLLEGMSLPRVRVPELTIDMPLTIDKQIPAKVAELDSPRVLHHALMAQLTKSLDDEDILSRTKTFQNNFDKELKLALENIAERQRSGDVRITKESLVRAVDDAFQKALKKTSSTQEIPFDRLESVSKQLRHRIAAIALKSQSIPITLKTSVVSSEVKESATPLNAIRLNITIREEGLEWATSIENGRTKSKLMPE